MKLFAYIAIFVCAAALAACTTAGPYASAGNYRPNTGIDMGGCSASPINPHRQDQVCNRFNGNPYN
jgi:hypothetical protein